MTREFVYLKTFDKNWKRLGLDEQDLILLERKLLDNPQSGKIIEGTGNLRKRRFALPNRGKSGSARVLYVDFAFYGKLFMINIYPKNEQENISDKEKQIYRQFITEAETILKRGC